MIEMYRYDGWSLLRGHFVEVRRRDNVVRRGFIEEATSDSEVMWLTADGTCTRQMFEKAEDYDVWVCMNAAQPQVPDEKGALK